MVWSVACGGVRLLAQHGEGRTWQMRFGPAVLAWRSPNDESAGEHRRWCGWSGRGLGGFGLVEAGRLAGRPWHDAAPEVRDAHQVCWPQRLALFGEHGPPRCGRAWRGVHLARPAEPLRASCWVGLHQALLGGACKTPPFLPGGLFLLRLDQGWVSRTSSTPREASVAWPAPRASARELAQRRAGLLGIPGHRPASHGRLAHRLSQIGEHGLYPGWHNAGHARLLLRACLPDGETGSLARLTRALR